MTVLYISVVAALCMHTLALRCDGTISNRVIQSIEVVDTDCTLFNVEVLGIATVKNEGRLFATGKTKIGSIIATNWTREINIEDSSKVSGDVRINAVP